MHSQVQQRASMLKYYYTVNQMTIYNVNRVVNPQRALLLCCVASFSSLFWFHDTFTVWFNLTALINHVSGRSRQLFSAKLATS